MFKGTKKLFGCLIAAVSFSVEAGVIDFTSSGWQQAFATSSSPFEVSYSGVTLLSQGGNLTFNDSRGEVRGCVNAQTTLACVGDGIGIRNDEITEGYQQVLTVMFDDSVDILDIHLLDLFGKERTGEVAHIRSTNGVAGTYHAIRNPANDAGGYWETGFTDDNVFGLMFFSQGDSFSDFSLARIVTADVPEPGSLILLGIGVVGLVMIRRRETSD